ncbi:MAG TPA: 2-oxo acid dehydrogenase subunit E2, partial [Gemmatimonadales bacterium]
MSEFVFGTHNAAFVQVMYEEYLRDPSSVAPEWRELFDNGKLAELPIIQGARSTEQAAATPAPAPAAPPAPRSVLPAPPGATPITGPAARLVQNMTESLTVPTATSFRDISATTLDARRKALNAQLAATGKKSSFTHLIG